MKKGLSQEYVADKLGMTQGNWSRLENGGRIDLQMLEKIAKALEVEDPLELLRSADLSIENSFNNQKECMNYFAPYLDFGKENTQKYITNLEAEIARLKAEIENIKAGK